MFTAVKGTKVSYRSSEAGRVSVKIERLGKSRRFRRYAGLTRKAVAGRNAFALRRKVAGRRLKRGTYRITLREADAAGNRSKRARAKFIVTAAR